MQESLEYLRSTPTLILFLEVTWFLLVAFCLVELYTKFSNLDLSKKAYDVFRNQFNINIGTLKSEFNAHKVLSSGHRRKIAAYTQDNRTSILLLRDELKLAKAEIVQLQDHLITNGLSTGARLNDLENPVKLDKKTKKKVDPEVTKKKRTYKKRTATKRGPYKTKKKVAKKTTKKVTKKKTKK